MNTEDIDTRILNDFPQHAEAIQALVDVMIDEACQELTDANDEAAAKVHLLTKELAETKAAGTLLHRGLTERTSDVMAMLDAAEEMHHSKNPLKRLASRWGIRKKFSERYATQFEILSTILTEAELVKEYDYSGSIENAELSLFGAYSEGTLRKKRQALTRAAAYIVHALEILPRKK